MPASSTSGNATPAAGGADAAVSSDSAGDASAAAQPVGGGDMLAASDAVQTSDPAAAADTTAVADSVPTESAQSLSIDSNDAGYAKPQVAALDYSSDVTSARQALLAKFRFAIFGSRVGSSLVSFSAGIHSRNSNTRQVFYVAFNELKCSAASTDYFYPMVVAANKADFWLRKADGTRSQWTSLYNTCDMNITSWGRKDSSGWTWTQRKAQFDYNNAFSKLPYVSYVFSDNTFGLPRVDADWERIGTNQSRTDSTVVSAQRYGQVAYWNALKGYKSTLRIIGNADNDLSSSQYVEKLNGAFFEGAIGRSWSIETWAGWDAMMKRYRALIVNSTSPNVVFLQAYGATTDYRTMRYGLASALLDQGYFVYLPSSGTLQPTWYDEYDAPIGAPVDAPPFSPKQNGIYMRRYQNGLVLVNPSKTNTASIYVGSGYKRLKGTQDPYVNNGQVQSTVTLGPRQGLIMVRN
ncbi:MAG: putative glycoside hydrolase [Betaproteobacteria bacterium]